MAVGEWLLRRSAVAFVMTFITLSAMFVTIRLHVMSSHCLILPVSITPTIVVYHTFSITNTSGDVTHALRSRQYEKRYNVTRRHDTIYERNIY